MPDTDELSVWRDGRIDAVLRERRGRLSLRYEHAARPISVSLPVRTTAYGDQQTRTWFRGLLPEGEIRLMIAYDIGVDPDDDFQLLGVLGRDCAGALSLRPRDDPPDAGGVGPALTDAEIATLLRELPTSPMGFDRGFRVSLPGNQHKLLLTRTERGWHRPDGAPSTHILKPPIIGLDATTVDNEAYCQDLAAAAGLPAATTTVEVFDGVRVLVSERYDHVSAGGSMRRVHQEDGCQATGTDPLQKYETAGGGIRLRRVAAALANNGGELADLLRMATYTVAIGNADWHGKNVSFVFDDDDGIAVAPVYDAMSTRFYETSAAGLHVEHRLGMYIGGEADIDAVDRSHLVGEARSWGMSERRAGRVVGETIEAIAAALAVVHPPLDQLRDLIAAGVDRLASA